MGAWAPAERRAAAARMHTSAEVERSDSCFPAQRCLELQTQACFQRCSPHDEALAVRGCAATRLTQTASEALAVRSSLALLQRRGALQCSEFLEDCLSEKSTPRWWSAVFKYGRENEDAMGRSDACAEVHRASIRGRRLPATKSGRVTHTPRRHPEPRNAATVQQKCKLEIARC